MQLLANKLLLLLMATACLGLVAACGESVPIEYEYPVYKRIMPLEPCPNDINAVDTDSKSELRLRYDVAEEVFLENELLFYGEGLRVSGVYPDYGRAVFEGEITPFLYDEGHVAKAFILVTIVADELDQSELPLEKRIPHCLEGVPVHFLTNQPIVYATPG